MSDLAQHLLEGIPDPDSPVPVRGVSRPTFTLIGYEESTGLTVIISAQADVWDNALRAMDIDHRDVQLVEVLQDGSPTYLTDSVCSVEDALNVPE